jgi:hypothetical protein
MKFKLKIKRIVVKVVSILAASTMILSAATPLWAEEEKPLFDLSLSALTKYIWRGQEMTRNSVVLQPSLTMTYKGFMANLWGNLDTKPYTSTNIDYPGNWTETDLTIGYNRCFGLLSAGAGYIYYGLAAVNKDAPDPLDSQEIYLTLGLNTLLSPTLTLYREIDHYHQWYIVFGVSHTQPLTKVIALKLSASASYLKSTDAATYPRFDDKALVTGEKYDNFHDGAVTASLPVTINPHWTVSPSLSYIFPLSDDARNEMRGRGIAGSVSPADRDSAFLYGGLIVNLTL